MLVILFGAACRDAGFGSACGGAAASLSSASPSSSPSCLTLIWLSVTASDRVTTNGLSLTSEQQVPLGCCPVLIPLHCLPQSTAPAASSFNLANRARLCWIRTHASNLLQRALLWLGGCMCSCHRAKFAGPAMLCLRALMKCGWHWGMHGRVLALLACCKAQHLEALMPVNGMQNQRVRPTCAIGKCDIPSKHQCRL